MAASRPLQGGAGRSRGAQAAEGGRRPLQGPTTATSTTIIDADLQFTGASSALVAQVSQRLAQNPQALVPVFAAALPAGTDVATVRGVV